METYLKYLLVLLAMALIGAGIHLYFRKSKPKRPMHEEYLWLGEGEHPLKRKQRTIKLR